MANYCDFDMFKGEKTGVCPFCGNTNVHCLSNETINNDNGISEIVRYMVCKDFENCDGGWYEVFDCTHRANFHTTLST